ncbi:MAG: YggT family protein [Burkholderiales bacterium]|jgi:YggT family protein|nr:YggT family protein [Burkholderiales bacterium]
MIRAVSFLLDTFLGLYAAALLVRFWLQAVRAPSRHPAAPFLAALTDWCVRPARRVIPGLWGLDIPTLLLAWATLALLQFALLVVRGWMFDVDVARVIGFVVIEATVGVVRWSIYVFIGALLAQAVLSWTQPYSPLAPALNALTRPLLGPFRRRIPPIGNVDLSPLFAIVALQLALMVVDHVAGLLR